MLCNTQLFNQRNVHPLPLHKNVSIISSGLRAGVYLFHGVFFLVWGGGVGWDFSCLTIPWCAPLNFFFHSTGCICNNHLAQGHFFPSPFPLRALENRLKPLDFAWFNPFDSVQPDCLRRQFQFPWRCLSIKIEKPSRAWKWSIFTHLRRTDSIDSRYCVPVYFQNENINKTCETVCSGAIVLVIVSISDLLTTACQRSLNNRTGIDYIEW